MTDEILEKFYSGLLVNARGLVNAWPTAAILILSGYFTVGRIEKDWPQKSRKRKRFPTVKSRDD